MESISNLDAAQKRLGYTGAAGAATGMTKAEAEDLIKKAGIAVPTINSKADAKSQLVTFFDVNNTGGKLLTEIYGTNGPQKTIATALQNAAPAA